MDELDELRLKIAKAKGYKWYILAAFPDAIEPALLDPKTKNNIFWIECAAPKPEFIPMLFDNKQSYLSKHLPDWPRDIAAAWELVEEMAEGFLSIQINKSRDIRDETPWLVWVFNDGVGIEKIAATAPEAICRAWLAWKEKKGGQNG